MSDLTGAVSIVTGAGAGIGEACARQLARAGSFVVVADIDESNATKVARSIEESVGTAAISVCVDVRSESSTRAMVGAAVDAFGRLDIAVNNAGVPSARIPVGELSFESWRATMSVNLDGVFLCMVAEIGAMKTTGGSIVNIGSILSSVAFENASAYVASKHGVLGLTRAAALDHASVGIRVNAVGPGFIATAQFDEANTAEEKASAAGLHPRGSLGSPDEVAALVTFLASPAAANITGGFFPCDGGFTAK
jgi:NAD(P)-dependent dehydrogenase (short-subunit alcohol dehydrogenase family)